MPVSARDRSRSANNRAARVRVTWWASAEFSAISFQVIQIGPGQNLAIAVCSAVRVVVLTAPRLFTSLVDCAYAALLRAGGAAGRNWFAAPRTKGVTPAQWVNPAAGTYGGKRR